jgi:hypothetical protein
MISNGVDPSLMKQQVNRSKSEAAANGFEIVSRELVISHMANKYESHREITLRHFETYLFPRIGNKPISDLTAPDILQCVKRP